MGELLLGWPKRGRGRLIDVYFPILFYIYFRTLITGRLIGRFIVTSLFTFLLISMRVNPQNM